MEREKREKWRSFVFAFVVTGALLALAMVGTVLAVQPTMPQNRRDTASRPEITYRPQAQDTLTLVVIGMDGDTPADFLLLRFNPQYGQVPLSLLPPETVVALEGEGLTLQQAYEKAGGIGVKNALAERLGISVDRYAKLPRDAFIQIAAKTGTVTFTLPYDISYDRAGYPVNLQAGERRLDGRDIADIFGCPSLREDPVERGKLLGDLTAAAINQNLDAASEAKSENLFKLAVNMIDTDVTYADFELRRQAADFVANLDATIAGNLPIDGTILSEGASFELSDGYVKLIRQYFQTTV